ncbi:MAG: sigma-54-dependent Fis family transcriptional regulator [Crocinitomicaceae bacterium]|nr:sigma-54-dependent Fis family transcriptional regulator [Crocinitomicaceae bacterium]
MSSTGIRIQIVEDNEWYNKLLVHHTSLNPDYVVKSFHSATEFLDQLSSNPDIVTLDYRLPDLNGVEVLSRIKKYNPDIQVIIISEQPDVATALELLKLGAFDYLLKEKDIRNKLLNAIQNIVKTIELRRQVGILEKEVKKKYDYSRLIIGESEPIMRVRNLIEKALSTNINVVITGETGTGKELVAKSIHFHSSRATNPFVAVNVAAIPSELLESELFGHEKGAFTGAAARRIGKFEEADGGTLFLDEIGEMDVSLQAKLLRVLQEKEVTRIGATGKIKINCRILVATNRNLRELVQQGKFREDLYYRLLGLPIEIPPLRDRGTDIFLLAEKFIKDFCTENGMQQKTLSFESEKKLLSFSFPGNVRELKAVTELAVVLSDTAEIRPGDIRFSSDDAIADALQEELSLREYELRIVHTFMKKYSNDVKIVASKLKIGAATIYRMLKESNGMTREKE